MSIIRCDKHDRNWDSDFMENCPVCVYESVGECPPNMTEGGEGSLLADLNALGELLGKPPIRFPRTIKPTATISLEEKNANLISALEAIAEIAEDEIYYMAKAAIEKARA